VTDPEGQPDTAWELVPTDTWLRCPKCHDKLGLLWITHSHGSPIYVVAELVTDRELREEDGEWVLGPRDGAQHHIKLPAWVRCRHGDSCAIELNGIQSMWRVRPRSS
jgi:hypothetical protein